MGKKGSSGQLVAEYLEKIDVSVIDSHEYKHVFSEFYEAKYGVYALYNDDDLYYVGLASDLKRRLETHIKDKHKGYWNKFSIYLTKSDKHIRELEALVIRIAEPSGNKVKGNFIAGRDIGKKLLKKMEESDRLKRELIFNKQAVKKKAIKDSAGRTSLKGIFNTNKKLVMYYKGKQYKAQLLKNGTVKMGRETFGSLSGAAVKIAGHARDGWTNWMFKDKDGKLKYMDELR